MQGMTGEKSVLDSYLSQTVLQGGRVVVGVGRFSVAVSQMSSSYRFTE
jgi:hypothetical protein